MNRKLATCLFLMTVAFATPLLVAQDARIVDRSRNLQTQGIAVVELFTSQGCSSCPPADALLKRIEDRVEESDQPIYTLSFHVDYWNRLGWRDPYSSAAATQRQRGYAAAMGSSRVHTPQMIVNGRVEFVGSNQLKANRAINDSLKLKQSVQVSAGVKEAEKKRLLVEYELTGAISGKVVNVAVVDSPKGNSVPRGENSGRVLSHVNIVRSFRSKVITKPTDEIELALPADLTQDTASVVVYIQDPKSLAILGATSVGDLF